MWILAGQRLQIRKKDDCVLTHSLGSRIVSATLQTLVVDLKVYIQEEMAKTAEERTKGERLLETLQNKNFRVYMLANQFPLLDLERQRPEIVGQIDAYCRPEGAKHDERVVNQVFIVAFSDPNDPLSHLLSTQLNVVYMVFDGPFGYNDAVQMVRQTGLHPVSKLRHDAALYFPYEGS